MRTKGVPDEVSRLIELSAAGTLSSTIIIIIY